jgi:hypothetical protein
VKKFLTLTAILEGLTGIALIAIPGTIGFILLGTPPNGPGTTIISMIAGAAILSLALICWLLRKISSPQKLVMGMLVYNCVIIAIALYGIFIFGLSEPGLWMIILFHSGLSVWGVITIQSKKVPIA